MLTISLEEIRFHAAIGLYAEEKLLGNDFLIDVHIHVEEESEQIETLSETVDYTKVYELVSREMQQEHQLLETVAQNCIRAMKKTWPGITGAEIVIRKLHPPMQGEVGCSKVTLSKKF